MIRLVYFLLLILSINYACSPIKGSSKNVQGSEIQLQNARDSVSYAIGIGIANFYAQQGVDSLNIRVLAKAIHHVFTNQETLLTEDAANSFIMNYLEAIEYEKAKPVIEAGAKFLEENKKRPGVTTTASGLQYEVIEKGTGRLPAATDTVLVHYKGHLLNGEAFDNSYERETPLRIKLNEVIKGWTEGLQLMPEGSTYKFYIPHNLAYGVIDRQPIPGGSVLVFEIKLLEVINK